MSTCTKNITLEIAGCPDGGTAPYFEMWFRANAVPIDLPVQGTGFVSFVGDTIFVGYAVFAGGDYYADYLFPSGVTGTVPIYYSLTGNPPPWISCDPLTGIITSALTDVAEIGNQYTFKVRASNACGTYDSPEFTWYGGCVVYWGEWLAPEPGSFSAAQIQTGLLDAYNYPATVGSRVSPPYGYSPIGNPYFPYGLGYFNGTSIEFPLTTFPSIPVTQSYIRVYAVPTGFFTGNADKFGNTTFDDCAIRDFTYKQTLSITVNGYATNYDVYTCPDTDQQRTVSACA